MGGLSKILGPALAIGGSALLGNYLFGGSSSPLSNMDVDPSRNIGPLAISGIGDLDLSSSLGSSASSIFSNPSVLSSGILAGTSLLSGLFGGSADEEALAAQQAEAARQFDAKLALEQAQLAQNLEIAKMQLAARGGGGGGGDNGAVAAQLKIAKANLLNKSAEQRAAALQIPLQARLNQSNAAQVTGTQSGNFFNNMAQILQAPALKRA